MSEKKDTRKGMSRSRSSSSSSSSSDDEYKNLSKEEKKARKKQKKLLKKQAKKERGRSSSSSSSSSSDEESKNLSKEERKQKKKGNKEKKKQKDLKHEKEPKQKKAKGKENQKPTQSHFATAQQKSLNVPTAEETDGETKTSKGREKDGADSDTASTSGKQKKEYKTEELRRLQEILRKEKSHIRKPKQRAHFPFVWTSLEPYYNTNTAAFLIDLSDDECSPVTPEPTKSKRQKRMKKKRSKTSHEEERPEPVMRSRTITTPEEFRHSYVSRNTAIGLCDPWVDLKMDHEILPKISSAQRTSTRCTHSTERSRERERKEKEAKEKKEKKGSTRLPKFPVVPFHAGKENATMRFPYQDIPKFRQEMDQRFSLHAPKKVENDYKRTKDDFYRMELDRLDEVHPLNRTHMRKAYFAYLQNTPGSKKAITECVRSLEGSVQQNSSGSAQKAH